MNEPWSLLVERECTLLTPLYSVSYVCPVSQLIPNVYLIKATFSIHKLIPKNAQMTTLYTNWSLYTTFTMIFLY